MWYVWLVVFISSVSVTYPIEYLTFAGMGFIGCPPPRPVARGVREVRPNPRFGGGGGGKGKFFFFFFFK